MKSHMHVEGIYVWIEASSQMLVWKDIYLFDELGFTKSKSDPNLYFKVMDDEPVILLLYLDDLFLTGNEKQIAKCKNKLL